MADELTLIRQRLDLLDKQVEVIGRSNGLEFERISKAFAQLGNLLDLLYLETSVIIDLLVKKNVFTQEEFTTVLEETAKKVEAQIEKAAKEPEKETPKADKL